NYASAFGTQEDVRTLADYTIQRHFPEIENNENKYLLLLKETAKRQASLIAKWQLVGFVHGVMNTDNMTISGETIDYGPCAFMDIYTQNTVFSSIDTEGRYAYGNQPQIGAWNLCRFAESLLPLLDEDEAKKVISHYWECFHDNFQNGMREKLGITNSEPQDTELIEELLQLMTNHKLDFTNTFRTLSLHLGLPNAPGLSEWQLKWQSRLGRQSQKDCVSEIMKKHNPAVIPRNHRVEEALSAAEQGDYYVMKNLLTALKKPYEDNKEYSQPPQSTCKYKTYCGT
ncbi:MAG: protein adenylyltransferase SelO family protein, partial [Clostridiales bacterium]|nr:protein adenylyltransferase SelO family protein [Clostridiales bacterium]